MGLIGEYIDYCFGSTKYDAESIREVFHSQDKKECKMENCPYQKGYICLRPFMKQYEDIVCGGCNKTCSCDGSPPPES